MDNRILTLMICGGIMLLMYIAILALILALIGKRQIAVLRIPIDFGY